jgi:ATP/maltotriose-dependent transcriptional regulator MalT
MPHVLYHIGDVEQALRTGEQAMQAAHEVGDRRILVQAASNLAHAHLCKGEFRRAIAIATPFAEDLQTRFRHERLGTTGTSACVWLGNLCGSNAMVGDFERALGYGEEAWRIAQQTNLPFDRAMSGGWLAFGLMTKGDTERSIPLVEGCLEVVRENDLEFLLLWNLMVYVASCAIAGESARALLMMEETADRRRRLRSLVGQSLWLGAAETMAICQSGQYERAETLCSELLANMAKHGMRTFEPLVLRMRGLSIARGPAGDLEAGCDWIRRARETATKQEALPEIAHADLELARLSADWGKLDDANTLASNALRAYRRMTMTEWEARAEAVLAIS